VRPAQAFDYTQLSSDLGDIYCCGALLATSGAVKRCTQIGITLLAALLSSLARAEAANGTLAVTASVQTSVALVTESDGSQRIVIANATDPRDNVSRVEPPKQYPVNGQPESKTSSQRRKK
jgi:hypothetical protein